MNQLSGWRVVRVYNEDSLLDLSQDTAHGRWYASVADGAIYLSFRLDVGAAMPASYRMDSSSRCAPILDLAPWDCWCLVE